MAIISAIREYIAGCPLLHDGAILGVDQLEADTIGYTVDTVPCEPVVQKYTDGSDKRQFLFVFAEPGEIREGCWRTSPIPVSTMTLPTGSSGTTGRASFRIWATTGHHTA